MSLVAEVDASYQTGVTVDLPRAVGGLPYLRDFSRLAEAICQTEMVPPALRGRADAVLAVMMSGFELGVGPMQALQAIDMIQGRPSISPELMRALVMQAGHEIILEQADDHATIRCHRRTWPVDQWSEFTWTMEVDAKRAGLTNKDNWKQYPRAMLSARVTGEACRAVFSDVIAGLSYTPDEVADFAPVPAGLSRPGDVALVGSDAAEAPLPASGGSTRPARAAAPTTIADGQVKLLRSLLGQIEIVDPIDVGLVVGGYIGRTVEALTELSADEARVALTRAKAALAEAAKAPAS